MMIRFKPSSMPENGAFSDFQVIYNGRVIAAIGAPVDPDPDDATVYITQATGEEPLLVKFEPPEEFGHEDKLDPEANREWLEQLAETGQWKDILAIGQLILDHYYPADRFIGSETSGTGPQYVTALRELLADIRKKEP